MVLNKLFIKSLHVVTLAVGMFICIPGMTFRADGQDYSDVQISKEPLVLKSQGSFFVGGETVEQSGNELGSFGPDGHITVNQMYVRFMIPQNDMNSVSVVLIHGMALTGKTWETTPDGRMGWDEYFVRKGHPVYVPDQVSRGRSGFNQAIFNNVRTGMAQQSELPMIVRFSDEVVWPNFRIGSKQGIPFPEEQYPVEALDDLSKQGVPDIMSRTFSVSNTNYKALSELSTNLGHTVLISHSQSGSFPLETALLNTIGIDGMVLVEPGSVSSGYDDQQIATLASIPILIIFGDYLDEVATGIPGFSWKNSYNGCLSFVTRVNEAGGNARMLYLPDQGIRGNSHMIMQDKNNLVIADIILKWIEENTGSVEQ